MEKLETIEYFSCVVTAEFAFFFTTNSSNSGPQSNMWESTFFIFNPLYKVTHPGKRRKWQLTEWKTQHNHPQILSTDSYRVNNVSGSLRVSETTFRCPWRQTISITVHDALCLLRSLLPQLYSAVFQRLRASGGYHHSEANGTCVGTFLYFKNSSLCFINSHLLIIQ